MTRKFYERQQVQTETGLRYVVAGESGVDTTIVVAEGEDPKDHSKRVALPTKSLRRTPKFELGDMVYFDQRPNSNHFTVGEVVARDVENEKAFIRPYGSRRIYRVSDGYVEKVSDGARKELSTRGLD